MQYYLDTEHNGYKGVLISLGIIREDGYPLYLINQDFFLNDSLTDPWVTEHVVPLIFNTELSFKLIPFKDFSTHLYDYFANDDKEIVINVDWPSDIDYLNQCIITGPGKMINIPGYTARIHRVDCYPNDLETVTQHIAIDDAIALRYKLTGKSNLTYNRTPVSRIKTYYESFFKAFTH